MRRFHLDFKRHKTTGLWAATSADLEGFLVMAESFDDLLAEIPVVAADLIEKQTGERVVVEWLDNDNGDFSSLSHEVQAFALA